MPNAQPPPDYVEAIPEPGALRDGIADAIRRADLLRSLLRVAIRKQAYDRRKPQATREEGEPCPG